MYCPDGVLYAMFNPSASEIFLIGLAILYGLILVNGGANPPLLLLLL